MLEDEEWGAWSDKEIARRAAVSDMTVGRIRKELSATLLQIDAKKVRRGQSTYEMTPGRKPRKKAAQPAQRQQEPAAAAPAPDDEGPPSTAAAPPETEGEAPVPPVTTCPLQEEAAPADALGTLLDFVAGCRSGQTREILHSIAEHAALGCWIEAADPAASLRGLEVHLRQQLCRRADADYVAARNWFRSLIEELIEVFEGRTERSRKAS